MARVRTVMPSVFVGHPFKGRFSVQKFRKIFKELPFDVQYGNTDIQTKHLLSVMKQNIKKADFAIFDLSDWNPNVALELGIAEGIGRRPLRNYYILLNTRRSLEVPSDIRGLQRLEYISYDYKKEKGLGYQLIYYILKKEYLIKQIEKAIGSGHNAEKMFLLALKIVGYLRDHDKLTSENVVSLSRGTRLRNKDEVVELLVKLKIIKSLKETKKVFIRGRKIYDD